MTVNLALEGLDLVYGRRRVTLTRRCVAVFQHLDAHRQQRITRDDVGDVLRRNGARTMPYAITDAMHRIEYAFQDLHLGEWLKRSGDDGWIYDPPQPTFLGDTPSKNRDYVAAILVKPGEATRRPPFGFPIPDVTQFRDFRGYPPLS